MFELKNDDVGFVACLCSRHWKPYICAQIVVPSFVRHQAGPEIVTPSGSSVIPRLIISLVTEELQSYLSNRLVVIEILDSSCRRVLAYTKGPARMCNGAGFLSKLELTSMP